MKEAHILVAEPGSFSNEDMSQLWSVLSNTEKKAAESYKFDRDRGAYVAAHGILRHCLGLKLNIPPQDLSFKTEQMGKPYVVSSSEIPIHFSITHIPSLVGCITTDDGPCGIDVTAPTEEIPFKSLSPGERQSLNEVTQDKHAQMFADIWALKEAYLKATGQGLTVEPATINISLSSKQITLLSSDENPSDLHLALSRINGLSLATATQSPRTLKILEIKTVDQILNK